MALFDFLTRRADGRAEPMALPRIEPIPVAGGPSTAKKGAIIGAAIATILGAIYVKEGGYVDHPNDPGGPTRFGVTEQVAREAGYSGDMRYFPKHCTGPATICADGIYVERYITEPGYMPIVELEPAVAEELVDSAVNFGPPRPSKWFQQSLNELAGAGLVVDGKVGPRSIAAFRQYQATRGKVPACFAMLDRLDAKQAAEYARLVRVNPRLKVFYNGWMKQRVGNVARSKCGKGV
jgi:lysozyme family protein